jgi:hypothetical protein
MQYSQQILIDEIIKLSPDKVGKALSFVRYLEKEPDSETEILLAPSEEAELRELLASGDFVSAPDVLSRIEALPND